MRGRDGNACRATDQVQTVKIDTVDSLHVDNTSEVQYIVLQIHSCAHMFW